MASCLAGLPEISPFIGRGFLVRHTCMLLRRRIIPQDGALYDPQTVVREDVYM